MPDYFALLNEPRRPWLDPESLKQKFLALSATVHPDRVHSLGEAERAIAQERYVELNGAYNCLRTAKDRIRHLLELERGALPNDIQTIPSDLMDLSLEVGEACRAADALLLEKTKTTSPILRVQFFQRGHEWTERLSALARKIGARHDLLIDEVREIDAAWERAAAGSLADHAGLIRRLEKLYPLFGYFTRWDAQVRERLVKLAL